MKTKFTLFLLVIALSICKPNKIIAQVNVQDSLALVDLYNSTDGPHWYIHSGWLEEQVKNWYGIELTGNRVDRILLEANNLSGSIPSSLGNINALRDLYLNNNQLSGSIPSSLGKLTSLVWLRLDYNRLSGSIPSSLRNLHPEEFFADHNQLSGSIPDSLYAAYGLYLSNNQLSGSIPPSVRCYGDMNLSYNQLSGSIPVFTFPPSDLNLSHNQLSGTIPLQINMPFNLDFSYNNLSGSISPEYGNNAYDVRTLNFSHNQLSGTIPPQLGMNDNIYMLDFSHNQLSGKIPPELGNLYNLNELDLSYNQLSDSITSSEFSDLPNLVDLNLSHNQLTGNINLEFTDCNCYAMVTIRLDSNQLSGNIPSSLSNLHKLVILNLSHNNLGGTIPATIGNLRNLAILNLSHNNLKGNIPFAFNKLINLSDLHLSYNKLRDTVPAFLANLRKLKTVGLFHNHFNFNGMEELVQHNFDTLNYDMQRKIELHQTNNILSVYAGGTLSNNTYNWYNGANLVATIVGDSTYQPTASGNYSVGVTNSIATELTLYSDTINYSINNLIALKKDNLIDENSISTISVYPNPAKTNATIVFSATGKYTIKLTDLSGNILQTKTGISSIKQQNFIQLNMSNYTPGIYYITIIDDKNEKQSLKLNKE